MEAGPGPDWEQLWLSAQCGPEGAVRAFCANGMQIAEHTMGLCGRDDLC